MWVIFDHLRPSGHIMPDHGRDRGAAHLDPGALRSPPYQPCADVAQAYSIAWKGPTRPGRPPSVSVPAKPQAGPGLLHATGATTSPTARPAAEAHPGDCARREPAHDLDYRLCCM